MWFDEMMFAVYTPTNYKQIVKALNRYAKSIGVTDDIYDADNRYAVNIIWERWCQGDYSIAPEPIFKE